MQPSSISEARPVCAPPGGQAGQHFAPQAVGKTVETMAETIKNALDKSSDQAPASASSAARALDRRVPGGNSVGRRTFWQRSVALFAALFVALGRLIARCGVFLWQKTAGLAVSWWQALPWRYRGHVLSRTLVGTVGGFYLAVSGASLIARGLMALEMPSNDARLTSQMLGFLIQAIALMWVFGCASQRRAWLGVGLPAALLAGVTWWLRS